MDFMECLFHLLAGPVMSVINFRSNGAMHEYMLDIVDIGACTFLLFPFTLGFFSYIFWYTCLTFC